MAEAATPAPKMSAWAKICVFIAVCIAVGVFLEWFAGGITRSAKLIYGASMELAFTVHGIFLIFLGAVLVGLAAAGIKKIWS